MMQRGFLILHIPYQGIVYYRLEGAGSMSNVKRFFNAMMMLTVFAVILMVFSIGYKTFFVDAGHTAMDKSESASHTQAAGQAQSPEQTPASATLIAAQQQYTGTPAFSPKGDIQKNKEMLEEIIAKLNDTVQYLAMEPISTGANGTDEAAAGDTKAEEAQAQTVSMQDMGLRYDAEKMAKLHSGIYKIAVGTAMLNKLKDNLTDQIKASDQNITDAAQHYSSLYGQAVENKALLTSALAHMSDAASLLNLNPYVSENGIPYDSERMTKLHQSVLNLAEGLATASMLETSFSKQVENYAAYVYIPAAPAVAVTQTSAAQAPTSHTAAAESNSIYGGLNIDYIAGFLPYAFGAFFLLGMIGYILNQAKSRSKAESTDVRPGEAS